MTNTPLRWDAGYTDSRKSEERFDCIFWDIVRQYPDFCVGTMMDLGANDGYFSKQFADRGFGVVAIEPSTDKDLNHRGVIHLSKWVQSSTDLPDETFDYSIALSVLHHIPDWKSVLNGLLMRTASLAYIEVPNPSEQHPLWFGSREQEELLQSYPKATIIGSFPESTGRHLRNLWRVETR